MAYTTPRTWVAGETVGATLLNAQIRDNFNAAFPLGVDGWTTYTPTLTQLGAVTKTVTYGKYQRVGRLVFVQVFLSCTGSGTAANAVTVSLPVTAAFGGASPQECGTGFIFDTSAGAGFTGQAIIYPSTSVMSFRSAATPAQLLGVAGFTAALASGDQVSASIFYEAAS